MWKIIVTLFAVSLMTCSAIIFKQLETNEDKRFVALHDEMLIRTCPHEYCWDERNENGVWLVCCRCNMHVKATCSDVKDGRIYVHPHRIYGVTFAYIPHD